MTWDLSRGIYQNQYGSMMGTAGDRLMAVSDGRRINQLLTNIGQASLGLPSIPTHLLAKSRTVLVHYYTPDHTTQDGYKFKRQQI